ncbi:hypothetical protein ZYGR_0Z01500 [Zygosaccharomyces rouxii]|uniref:Uncharacterized protein n=1 Tax=Zygosaccharomyces rouxii TaxID=4956 RepID=A0A1Q3A4X8_ZYGRO|nr:hypothetical protein ZYGR_0Z01500 [Zygosaccharomyces rouxii]
MSVTPSVGISFHELVLQEEYLMSLRPILMYASTKRPTSCRSQDIFEKAVQDPFGWSSEDSPPSFSGFNGFSKSDSFNGFDRWCMGGNNGSDSSTSSTKDGNGVPKSSQSPPRSNSIPTHLFGLERYVSSGLDELSARDCAPLGKQRKKSFIEMSLASSFSRDE